MPPIVSRSRLSLKNNLPAGSPWRRCLHQPTKLAFIASTSTQALTLIPQGILFIHSHLSSLLDFSLFFSTTELNTDGRIKISNMCMWFPFGSKEIYTYLTFSFVFLCLLLLYSLLFDPWTLRPAFWVLAFVLFVSWVGAGWGLRWGEGCESVFGFQSLHYT